MILLPVWLFTICSIRGSLFSNSCPQELHLSFFYLWVLFIWWASDTWMVVVFGHIRHLCSSFMYIIIVFVHYLFKCTRLTLSMYVLFKLVLSSDFFFITDKTWKCSLVMNISCGAFLLCIFRWFLKGNL